MACRPMSMSSISRRTSRISWPCSTLQADADQGTEDRRCALFHAAAARTAGKSNYPGEYPAVDSEFLKQKRYRDTNVMHPLPRVDELSYDIDEDKRSMYFKQAAYGVPVRMALIASLLELQPALVTEPSAKSARYRVYSRAGGIECNNEKCVSQVARRSADTWRRGFGSCRMQPPTLRCVYCDVEQQPRAFGTASTHKFATDMAAWQQANDEELIFFSDSQQADKAKYEERKSKPRKKSPRNELVGR